MKIGSFSQDDQGNVSGRISGLGIGSVPVFMQPEVSRAGEPFFKLIADNPDGDPYEIGAAFPKQKNGGAPYHSVSLDSPFFPEPINAAMFFDPNTSSYNMVWDRKPQAAPKMENKAEAAPPKAAPKAKQNAQALKV